MSRCKAETKNGVQCRNNAIPGTAFCYILSHGRIHKSAWQRFLNLLRNQWQPLTIISLCLSAVPIYWHFRDKKLSATSGVLSTPTESGPVSISVGSAELQMLSKDGVCNYPSDLHFGSCPGIERLKRMAASPHPIFPLYFPIHFCLQK